MVHSEGHGIPVAATIESACPNEVTLIESLLDSIVIRRKPKRLLYDKAADSDPLRSRFPRLSSRDDLWQLLVMLTARKAANQRKFLRANKRGGGKVRGESVFGLPASDGELRGVDQVSAQSPPPELAIEMAEEVGQLLDRLDDDVIRLVAFFKFEGRTNNEIAAALDCSITSVERKLRIVRRQLAERPAEKSNAAEISARAWLNWLTGH
jgi:hypothetical protein